MVSSVGPFCPWASVFTPEKRAGSLAEGRTRRCVSTACGRVPCTMAALLQTLLRVGEDSSPGLLAALPTTLG